MLLLSSWLGELLEMETIGDRLGDDNDSWELVGRSETVSCVDPTSVIIAVDIVDGGCWIEVSDNKVVVFPKE